MKPSTIGIPTASLPFAIYALVSLELGPQVSASAVPASTTAPVTTSEPRRLGPFASTR